MNVSTWNTKMNDSELDFDIADTMTLDDAVSMVEWQESLAWDDIEWEESLTDVLEETGHYHININKSQKQQIRSQVRTKAEQEGKVALFVPDWVSLRSPRPSFNRMLQVTNDLYERMQEYLSEYMVEFNMPKESRYAIEQQLLIMLVPKYSPRNIYDVCKQAAEVADQLEHNLNPDPNKEERVIPARAYKWGEEDVANDLSDVAY